MNTFFTRRPLVTPNGHQLDESGYSRPVSLVFAEVSLSTDSQHAWCRRGRLPRLEAAYGEIVALEQEAAAAEASAHPREP